MPTNLNALIRYKQIDKELRNPYRNTTLKSLQEACTKQLEEFRGIKKLVSERTIYDDLRVMRSGALGFEAPIIIKNGVYSYEDENFSMFNEQAKERQLLGKVYEYLFNEQKQINNPELAGILNELEDILGFRSESYIEPTVSDDHKSIFRNMSMSYEEPKTPTYEFSWKRILEVL